MDRFKAFALAALAIGTIGGSGAPAARAESGDVQLSCGQASFHYSGFGDGTHTVQETIDEETVGHDWDRVEQVEFTFTGDSADHVVDFHLDPGPHTLRADSGLDTPATQWVLCEAPPDRFGDVDLSCGRASYHYEGFGEGTHTVQETIYEDTGGQFWDRLEQVEFTFEGPTADHVVDFDLPTGAHTLRGDSWNFPSGGHIAGFAPPRPQQVQCDPPPPPCPTGQIAMRWHYRHGDQSGSGRASQPVGCPGPTTVDGRVRPASMKIAPGGHFSVGYSLSVPDASMTVETARIAFRVRCEDGLTPSASNLRVSLAAATSTAVVPNVCAGAKVILDRGGVFSANVG